MDYIIRTLQSHYLVHCEECTEHFLDQENCKEIGLENYECTLSAQASIWVGTLSMSLQCICSVPTQCTTLCPQCEIELTDLPLCHTTSGKDKVGPVEVLKRLVGISMIRASLELMDCWIDVL